MDTGLAGRTVLVTGASGGIGQTLVRAFADEGARVIVHYRTNRAAAQEVVNQIGDRGAALGADLTDERAVARLFDDAAAQFGPVQHLVGNAGVWPPESTPLAQMTLEQWNSTLAVDLTSVFLTCREFLRRLHGVDSPDPSIVLIGSTAGVFGEAGHADYASCKSALLGGLLLTLKNEIVQIAERGRVNTVSPGWTMTPMTRKFADDERALNTALATIALKKVATPADIAGAVVFLSSPRVAGHISGQNLVVSGGMEGRVLNADSPD